jgi:hypothetical protein
MSINKYFHYGPDWLTTSGIDTANLPMFNGRSNYWVNCHNMLHYLTDPDFSDIDSLKSKIQLKLPLLTIQKEHIFENIRLQYFSNLPTRSKCIFLMSQKHLNDQTWSIMGTPDRALLVAHPIGDHSTHEADSVWLDCNSKPISIISEMAKKYWFGEMSKNPKPEVLYLGKLKFSKAE